MDPLFDKENRIPHITKSTFARTESSPWVRSHLRSASTENFTNQSNNAPSANQTVAGVKGKDEVVKAQV